jgi:hypothetical protein
VYNTRVQLVEANYKHNKEDTTSSSLYPQIRPLTQERLSQSTEACGTNYYKTNTNNRSSGNRGLTSTTTMDQRKSQTTTRNHSIVDSHQNPSRKKTLKAYKSETHQYLHLLYRMLPHHTVQEQQNQEDHAYQSSRHHQYSAVALLLLNRNNIRRQWHQLAPRRLLSPLNPH